MVEDVSNLFWDSCVFYAFLNDERAHYDVDGIAQYLQEAKSGKFRIHASTLILAEVTPNAITKKGIGSFQDFLDDLQGAVVLMAPSPNIMHTAAKLKDLPYKKGNGRRRLSTTDAIMLATCVHLRDAFGTKVDFFHTFDDGKKRGLEGKMVPLISYEEWCEGFTQDQQQIAKPVIELNRRKPIHPTPKLAGL